METVILKLLQGLGTELLLVVLNKAIELLKDSDDNDICDTEHSRVKNALAEYRARNGSSE